MHNEKKRIDWMEKKLKWDELQVEMKRLHDCQWCLLVQLNWMWDEHPT